MKTRSVQCFFLFILLVSTFYHFQVWAQVPGQINFQGNLSAADGSALDDGAYPVIFRIYRDGVTLQWEETQSVDLLNGSFSVLLPHDTINHPFPEDLFDGELFLSMAVSGDDEMAPMLKLVSTAFAMRAEKAEGTVDGAITSLMLANDAVQSINVADDAILPEHFADGAVITGILAEDGENSGLDADFLDGRSSSDFLEITGGTMTGPLSVPYLNIGGETALIVNHSTTFVGHYAGQHNTGFYNTFLGHWTGRYNKGNDNTIVGMMAGAYKTFGDKNVFLGSYSGFQNSGDHNTFLGYYSGYGNTSGSGNLFLGYHAGENELGSNKLYIANSDTNEPLIYGEFDNQVLTVHGNLGVGTTSPQVKLHVDGGTDSALSGGGFFVAGELSGTNISFDDNEIMARNNGEPSTLHLQHNGGDLTINNNQFAVSDSKVGIGTNSPEYELDVRGNRIQLKEDSTNEWIALRTDGGALDVTFAGGPLYIQGSNDGEHILLNPNRESNVGIGTSQPGEKLEVGGNVKIEGSESGIIFPDGSKQKSAAAMTSKNYINPMQIALKRWYEVNESNSVFPVGEEPLDIAFDGANIWISNWDDHSITKLRAADGSLEGTYYVGNNPKGLAFDGANIWIASNGNNRVYKIKASNGSIVGSYSVGNRPLGIAFDGANIWVSNVDYNWVTKLKASDGSLIATYVVGSQPCAVVFDGANIWVSNQMSNNVTKLRASDGNLVGTYPVGSGPQGMVFDGDNIWVANYHSHTVTKLKASDGSLMGTFAVGNNPTDIVFDGAGIWVANSGSNTVTKLKSSDGGLKGTYTVGTHPQYMSFDGVNVWVSNRYDDTVQKL